MGTAGVGLGDGAFGLPAPFLRSLGLRSGTANGTEVGRKQEMEWGGKEGTRYLWEMLAGFDNLRDCKGGPKGTLVL